MRLSSKMLSIMLLTLMLHPSLFSLDQVFTARLGGSLDRNVGTLTGESDFYHFKAFSGSFATGLTYDMFLTSLVSLGPEFHFNLNRNAKLGLEDQSIRSKWQELSLGLQAKFNILGFLYMGVGSGAGFALTPTITPEIDKGKSSIYPYFALEIGGNVPFLSLSNGMIMAVHLAMRGTSNINVWKKQPKSGYFQNDFSIGFFTGISILSLSSLSGGQSSSW